MIAPLTPPEHLPMRSPVEAPLAPSASDALGDHAQVREAFDDFVGQTFFSQLLGSMRQTVSKPAYFHGGRAEEIFQGQLDQVLAEKMAEHSAHQFTDPMFQLFMLTPAK